MARKFFLASVGNAEAYATRNGEFAHVLSARTLTESTLGFTSSMEEVRAGQGAKLYGRFNHSAGMTVSLTDAMFDMNYIALQTGSQIQTGASAIYCVGNHLSDFCNISSGYGICGAGYENLSHGGSRIFYPVSYVLRDYLSVLF